MVQMRVTPGPQNQAQRTQSVSPIGLVVNGLHCAASHTHDFSQGVTLTCQLLNHAVIRSWGGGAKGTGYFICALLHSNSGATTAAAMSGKAVPVVPDPGRRSSADGE